MSINQVVLTGFLGAEPIVKYTDTGVCKVSFSLGSSWYYKAEEKSLTDWLDIKAKGNLAEFIGNNLGKGSHITIHGRLKSYTYEDKEGNKRKITYVQALTIELDKKIKKKEA